MALPTATSVPDLLRPARPDFSGRERALDARARAPKAPLSTAWTPRQRRGHQRLRTHNPAAPSARYAGATHWMLGMFSPRGKLRVRCGNRTALLDVLKRISALTRRPTGPAAFRRGF